MESAGNASSNSSAAVPSSPGTLSPPVGSPFGARRDSIGLAAIVGVDVDAVATMELDEARKTAAAALTALKDKDADAALAAEIGSTLLARNEAAEAELVTLRNTLAEAGEALAASEHRCKSFEELLESARGALAAAQSNGGGHGGGGGSMDLEQRLRDLSEDNAALLSRYEDMKARAEKSELDLARAADEVASAEADALRARADAEGAAAARESARVAIAATEEAQDAERAALERCAAAEANASRASNERDEARAELAALREENMKEVAEASRVRGEVAAAIARAEKESARAEGLVAKIEGLSSRLEAAESLVASNEVELEAGKKAKEEVLALRAAAEEDATAIAEARKTIGELKESLDAMAVKAASGTGDGADGAAGGKDEGEDSLFDELERELMSKMHTAGGPRKAPSEEYFVLSVIALKLKLSMALGVSSRAVAGKASAGELWEKVNEEAVPFHEWASWAEKQIHAAYTGTSVAPLSPSPGARSRPSGGVAGGKYGNPYAKKSSGSPSSTSGGNGTAASSKRKGLFSWS